MYLLKRLWKGLLSTLGFMAVVLAVLFVLAGPLAFGLQQLYWIHGAVAVIFCLWEAGEPL